MSVPYFFVKTNKMPIAQRGELTPNGDAQTMRSHLYRYYAPSNRPGTTHVEAVYAVDHITPTSKSCLLITQDYEFDPPYPGEKCEPTGTAPCARFYPRVTYDFLGRAGETLDLINVGERLHFREDGKDNTVGLFRDCDLPLADCGLKNQPALVFRDFVNPLLQERADRVVQHGQYVGPWDNMHQTSWWFVSPPLTGILQRNLFGCPECVHTHCRWGRWASSWRPASS